jgi:hypothetical protein
MNAAAAMSRGEATRRASRHRGRRGLSAGAVVAGESGLGAVPDHADLDMARHLLVERAQADVVMTPVIAPTRAQYGLSDRAWLIKTGEAAAEQALPLLRAAMKPGP